MRFNIGQKVVCVTTKTGPVKATDKNGNSTLSTYYPKYGEIVTVIAYSRYHKNHIELSEYSLIPSGMDYPNCYRENYFEPLMEISELTEILESQPEHA